MAQNIASKLEIKGISKSFGATRACSDVSFTIEGGEVAGLVGENGAGKSTVIKIIGGINSPDHGKMYLDGALYAPRNPSDAQDRGVGIVPQEVNILPELPVWVNVMVGRIPIRSLGGISAFSIVDQKLAQKKARSLFELLGIKIEPNTLAKYLSRAEKQLVEIARALVYEPRLLIMDEPTASLEQHEVECLFELVRRLKSQGYGVVFVSHKLDEVLEISSKVVVLRDSVLVTERRSEELTVGELAALVAGKKVKSSGGARQAGREEIMLEVKGLAGGRIRKPIELDIKRGQVVGVTGLLGSGASDLFRLLMGRDTVTSGAVHMEGVPLTNRDLRDRKVLSTGVSYLPEDRRNEGLFPELSVAENIIAGCLGRVSSRIGQLQRRKVYDIVAPLIEMLNIKSPSPDTPVKMLSGGNQQKVLMARCMATQAKLFLLEEPTHGVDIGTKWEIRTIMRKLADAGNSILFRSVEADEVLENSHEIAVFYEGDIVARVDADEADKESIISYCSGSCVPGKEA